jgi:hypothetical protein
MPMFLTSIPREDISMRMERLLINIEQNAEYIPSTTFELMQLEEAFNKSYVFEVGASLDAL